jgi:hypothetical protein
MQLRFYLNPETGQPHIYDHGVTEQEVWEVLRRPGEDRPGEDKSRVAIGQTTFGRHLKVIYTRDPGGRSVFVITAYDLTGKALKAYRRRLRRRRR